MHVVEPRWRERFVLASEAATPGERNALARLAARGRLIRLAPGVYLDPTRSEATTDARARDRVRARALRSPDLVFGHASAAALWMLPSVDLWPERVEVVGERAAGGRSTTGVRQYRVGAALDVVDIDGVRVTGLARTVVDLAATASIATALAAADAALAGIRLGDRRVRVERSELASLVPGPGERGAARARFVVAFADGRSESAGESLSRLAIHRAGLPAPDLQLRVEDRRGAMFADFAWPSYRLIGEFDGMGKYVRSDLTAGRDPAEVVVAEKLREDRLRAAGWRVVRWGWAQARSVPALRQVLTDAGLR